MKKAIAAIIVSTALAISANAAIVFGNLGASGTDGLGDSGRTLSATGWSAVGFTAAAPFTGLTSATIGLDGTGNVRLDLFTNAGGSPGTSIASTTQSIATIGAQKITFNLNSDLTSGTSYWFVARLVSGNATWVSNFDESAFGGLNASGWSSLGGRATSNSGSSWTSPNSAQDLSISVNAIPEPGTWAAMAIFASGAAYAGWRRQRQQLAA